MEGNEAFIVGLLALVQILGVSSTLIARMGEGRPCQAACQFFFLCTLMLVAGSALVAFVMGPGYFLTAGGCLAWMVIGAVWDFRGGRRAATV